MPSVSLDSTNASNLTSASEVIPNPNDSSLSLAVPTVEKKFRNLEKRKSVELLNTDLLYDDAKMPTASLVTTNSSDLTSASNMTFSQVIPNPNDSSLSLAVQTAEKKDRNLDDFEDLVSFYVKSFLIGNCENFVKTTDIRTFFKA